MVNDKLVLQINKLNSTVDSKRLKYNQAERGRAVDIIVIDNDGVSPYDLTDKTIVFNEDKINNKIIIDGGDGEDSGKFTRTPENDKQGKFTYEFQKAVYQQSGEARFEFTKDNNHIDVTSDFYIDIEAAGVLKPDNTSYISDMTAFKANYKAIINNTNAKTSELLKQLKDQTTEAISNNNQELVNKLTSFQKTVQGSVDQFNAKAKELSNKLAGYETQYNDLSKNWDQKATKDITDTIASINGDYNTWKNKTVSDFESAVKPIKESIDKNSQDLSGVTKQVNDTLASMKKLQEQFNGIDFTNFLKKSDLANYFTKDEIKDLLKSAGQVKTATINGGAKVTPDLSGNLALTVPNPDLSGLATKQEVNTTNSRVDVLEKKKVLQEFDTPQKALEASKTFDGITFYDMNNGPQSAVIAGQPVNIESLHNDIQNLQSQVGANASAIAGKVDANAVEQQIGSKGFATKQDIQNALNAREQVISKTDYDKIQNKNNGIFYYVTE